ncbi:ATPase [bacterium endosymbiont of Escarpia laminata]|nr:MAG: ATPase [bacterium endosymbiont of Escarpia laminata]
MSNETQQQTRLIFMGSTSIANGFRLIGFETRPDPSLQEVDQLFSELLSERQHAFIVIDNSLEKLDSKLIQQIRNEGGRIVLSEVPSLDDPNCYQCSIDRQLSILIGEESNEGVQL